MEDKLLRLCSLKETKVALTLSEHDEGRMMTNQTASEKSFYQSNERILKNFLAGGK